jgi:hypothetical protein
MPIVTGCGDFAEGWGEHQCQLAFHRLPALERSKPVDRENMQGRKFVNGTAVQRQQCAGQSFKYAYHPLTDIDWQGGGHFKPSFSRKVARQEMEQPNRSCYESVEGIDERLSCVANSRFARNMLNDTIYHSRYCDHLKRIDVALLGCRLFVYQNTFLYCTKPTQQQKTERLIQAFYWTLYVIESFIKGKTIKDKLHLHWRPMFGDNALLEKTLRSLYGFNGDVLETEFMWLHQLPGLLGYFGLDQHGRMDSWWCGFRYLPGQLCERALLDCGAGLSRRIQMLDGFKRSGFFKLNKAAEYHTQWLAQQLCQHGIEGYDTTQSIGDSELWQL